MWMCGRRVGDGVEGALEGGHQFAGVFEADAETDEVGFYAPGCCLMCALDSLLGWECVLRKGYYGRIRTQSSSV